MNIERGNIGETTVTVFNDSGDTPIIDREILLVRDHQWSQQPAGGGTGLCLDHFCTLIIIWNDFFSSV